MEVSTPGRAVLLFCAAFLMLMIVIPLVYPYGSFVHLDGKAGVIDNWGKLMFADPLTRAVYFLGDLFCHEEMSRSFIINGSQMAFCQRDVSVLSGVILGLIVTDKAVFHLYVGKKPFLILASIMIITLAVEWGIESVFGVNLVAGRVATGILAGAGIALLLQYAVTKEYEEIMFGKEFDKGV